MTKICFSLIFLLSNIGFAWGTSLDNFKLKSEPAQKGPVKAIVALEHEEVSILETQKLILKVSAPKDMEVNVPYFDQRLEDFRIIPYRGDEEEIIDGEKVQTFYRALELFESGEQIIPPFNIKFSTGSGANIQTSSFKTPILKFNISPIDDATLINKDLHPIEGLTGTKPNYLVYYIILGIIIALISILVIIKLVKKEKKPKAIKKVVIPAHTLAYKEIEALVARKNEENLSHEVFVSELSNILRRYIERRYFIKAYEQTTEEFLHYILNHSEKNKVLQQYKEVLEQFLNFTDLIKFAAQNAPEEDVQKGFDFLKEFIEKTKSVGGVV